MCVCVHTHTHTGPLKYIYFRGPVHEFVHGWGPASLARQEGTWVVGQPACWSNSSSRGQCDISLLLYRIYTEWPDYYAFRDHNDLATQCILQDDHPDISSTYLIPFIVTIILLNLFLNYISHPSDYSDYQFVRFNLFICINEDNLFL